MSNQWQVNTELYLFPLCVPIPQSAAENNSKAPGNTSHWFKIPSLSEKNLIQLTYYYAEHFSLPFHFS